MNLNIKSTNLIMPDNYYLQGRYIYTPFFLPFLNWWIVVLLNNIFVLSCSIDVTCILFDKTSLNQSLVHAGPILYPINGRRLLQCNSVFASPYPKWSLLQVPTASLNELCSHPVLSMLTNIILIHTKQANQLLDSGYNYHFVRPVFSAV